MALPKTRSQVVKAWWNGRYGRSRRLVKVHLTDGYWVEAHEGTDDDGTTRWWDAASEADAFAVAEDLTSDGGWVDLSNGIKQGWAPTGRPPKQNET